MHFWVAMRRKCDYRQTLAQIITHYWLNVIATIGVWIAIASFSSFPSFPMLSYLETPCTYLGINECCSHYTFRRGWAPTLATRVAIIKIVETIRAAPPKDCRLIQPPWRSTAPPTGVPIRIPKLHITQSIPIRTPVTPRCGLSLTTALNGNVMNAPMKIP
jgi:hypothetical protein